MSIADPDIAVDLVAKSRRSLRNVVAVANLRNGPIHRNAACQTFLDKIDSLTQPCHVVLSCQNLSKFPLKALKLGWLC